MIVALALALTRSALSQARSNTWIIAIVIVTLALALGLGVGLGVGLNKKEDSTISTYSTIADVACGTNAPAQFSTLCAAIAASPTVLAALSAAGTYTVFAPNNDAFDALPDGALADLLKPENAPALTNLLLKHTLGSKVPAADALNLVNEPVDTLASTNSITEKIVVDGNGNAGPVTITPAIVGGSAEVVAPNLAEADNGGSVIHEINKVIATWSYMSIAQVACDPSLDATVGTLCAAVGASSAVADALSNSGSYTVFAPTNGAFAALDQTFLQSVLADDAIVTALLQKHALGSVVPASVALTLENSAQTTLNGEDITVDGSTGSVLVTPSILGGPSTVISADVQTSNGVIHVVDKVLALAALVPPPSPPPPAAP